MAQRVAQLEQDLANANQTIARLKGDIDERSSDELADMLVKPRFTMRRELERELGDTGLEAIAAMLRTRLPNSTVSMVGKTLHCKWGNSTVEVRCHTGRSEIRLEALDAMPTVVKAMVGMGFAVLGGPLVAGLVAGLASVAGAQVPGWLGAAFAPFALVLGYLAASQLHNRTLRLQRTKLRGALEAAVELIEQHGREPIRQRIAVEPASELAAEEEALAEAEADEHRARLARS